MNLRLDTAFDASSVPFGSAISAMLSYLSFKPDFHFGLRESTELVAPLFLNSYPNRNRRRMLTRAACGGASPPSTIAGQGHKLRKQPPEAKHAKSHAVAGEPPPATLVDRKSTRLNSSHRCISYAVFCLKK